MPAKRPFLLHNAENIIRKMPLHFFAMLIFIFIAPLSIFDYQ